MPKFTFKRAERLKSRKTIERMFKEGKSFGMYPLRLVWLAVGEGSPPQPPLEGGRSLPPVQFTVSVPKRNFKSAVARNRIKRKVREAWRLNKHWLYERLQGVEGQLAFMVLYTAKEDMPYPEIEAAMRRMNQRFLKKNFPNPANPKDK